MYQPQVSPFEFTPEAEESGLILSTGEWVLRTATRQLRVWLDAGLPALELTESVAMNDPPGAVAIMGKLHQRGVRLSTDDFGTGYSSLSCLKRFKVCKLKVDQSLVQDISTDLDDKAIVVAAIALARSLGFQTIAEGVETPGQLDFCASRAAMKCRAIF